MSNAEGSFYKKVKPTEAEKLLKKNYENTVAFLEALKNKQARENRSRDRAKRRVKDLNRSGSHSTMNDANKTNRSKDSNDYDGIDFGLNGKININLNSNINISKNQRNNDVLYADLEDIMNRELTNKTGGVKR